MQELNHRQKADDAKREIIRSLSPAQKWEQLLRMREVAITLKRAGVRAAHSDWSDEQIDAEVRRIFLYASD